MILIREYNHPQDYLAVRALWEGIGRGIKVGRSDAADEIAKKVSRDPDLFLVAEVNDCIIGSVIGGYDGRRGLLYHLAVARDAQKHGVGGRLLEEVEARLRAKGCLKCYLMVTLDNSDVEEFYKKHGWHYMDYVRPFGKDLT